MPLFVLEATTKPEEIIRARKASVPKPFLQRL